MLRNILLSPPDLAHRRSLRIPNTVNKHLRSLHTLSSSNHTNNKDMGLFLPTTKRTSNHNTAGRSKDMFVRNKNIQYCPEIVANSLLL